MRAEIIRHYEIRMLIRRESSFKLKIILQTAKFVFSCL